MVLIYICNPKYEFIWYKCSKNVFIKKIVFTNLKFRNVRSLIGLRFLAKLKM